MEERIDMEFEWSQAETVQIAAKSKESLFDAPSVISLITKEEIRNLNPRNLVDIINTIPGFDSHVRELGETLFQIRGTHSAHHNILLMTDGHAVNNRIFGSLSSIVGSIPIESVERIEIIRGPGSVMYGTNAFHAVINVITVRDQEGSEKRTVGKIGSDKTVSGVATTKIKEGNFHISATGSYLHSKINSTLQRA